MSKNPSAVSLGKIRTPKKAKSSAQNGKKADEIRARLYINDIAGMDERELAGFKEWLKRTAKELTTEKDLNIFAKRYRATLYNPTKVI